MWLIDSKGSNPENATPWSQPPFLMRVVQCQMPTLDIQTNNIPFKVTYRWHTWILLGNLSHTTLSVFGRGMSNIQTKQKSPRISGKILRDHHHQRPFDACCSMVRRTWSASHQVRSAQAATGGWKKRGPVVFPWVFWWSARTGEAAAITWYMTARASKDTISVWILLEIDVMQYMGRFT